MCKTFFLTFVVACSAVAQPLSYGVKLGLPLTDAYQVSTNRDFTSSAHQYTVGAMAELHLPLGIGIEGDILYNRLNFSTNALINSLTNSNSNSWEIPILVKYKFAGFGPAHAYVGAGPSFRTIQSVLRFNPKSTNDSFGKGVVFSGGVELKALFLRISPELRYTHWGSQSFVDGLNVLVRGQQNQAQFLVGISF